MRARGAVQRKHVATSEGKVRVPTDREASLQTCTQSGREGVMMLLSEDTANYPDAAKEAEKFWRR